MKGYFITNMERAMSIFKANDIRGIYGKELYDSDACQLGRVFVRFTKNNQIVVGRDNRKSSPALHKALVKGLMEQGADVIDIGIIDSPGLYFASHHFQKPAMMITASHNPPKHNGFYLCRKDGESIYKDNGLREIEKLFSQTLISGKKQGKLIKKPINELYKKHILSFVDNKIKPMKIVIDAGNGVGSIMTKEIFKHFPQIKLIKLNFKSDGSFPNRGPDTTIEKNLFSLCEKVTSTGADFGCAFDGDADRIAFVDEKGTIIEGSLIGALLAESILKKSNKKEKVVYTIGCSRVVPEVIKENYGQSFREKVGHSFVNARMRTQHALFGIEHTGHYFYRSNFYTESPFITLLKICEIYSEKSRKMSEIMNKYEKYYRTKEISFPAKNQNLSIKKIKNALHTRYKCKIDTFDGLFLDLGTWWFRIRASQTESLIRFTIEGLTKEIVESKKQELIKLIKHTL